MIPIRTDKEIEIMKEGGRRLAWVLDQVLGAVRPGVSLKELDQLAESLIEKKGGRPSFKEVRGYNWATCINVNQGVVHGVPNEYQLKNGDVVSLDVGMFYKGLHTDVAYTILTSQESKSLLRHPRGGQMDFSEVNEFLKTGERALKAAIKAARPENRVGHISAAIEREIRKAGFSPIENLTGHGVGKRLHEEPQIPCFLRGKIKDTPKLRPKMTLAIEVIYAQGSPRVVLADDGWAVETVDGQLASLFEDTIVITTKEPLILTRLDSKPLI